MGVEAQATGTDGEKPPSRANMVLSVESINDLIWLLTNSRLPHIFIYIKIN